MAGALLKLSTAQPEVDELFGRYSTGGEVSMGGWLDFVRSEQMEVSVEVGAGADNPLGQDDNMVGAELRAAKRSFTLACDAQDGEIRADGGVDRLSFSLLLLSSSNDAVHAPPEANLNHPLAHYFIATSHNSYITGDQLTGRSSADSYRRILLQADPIPNYYYY